jgi:hypothetical protein
VKFAAGRLFDPTSFALPFRRAFMDVGTRRMEWP